MTFSALMDVLGGVGLATLDASTSVEVQRQLVGSTTRDKHYNVDRLPIPPTHISSDDSQIDPIITEGTHNHLRRRKSSSFRDPDGQR